MIIDSTGIDFSDNFGYAAMEERIRDANLPEGSDVTLVISEEQFAAMSSPNDVLHAWKVAATVHNLVPMIEGPDDFLAFDKWGMTAPDAVTSDSAESVEEAQPSSDAPSGGPADLTPDTATDEASGTPDASSSGSDSEGTPEPDEPSADSEGTGESASDPATPPTTDTPSQVESESAPTALDHVNQALAHLAAATDLLGQSKS